MSGLRRLWRRFASEDHGLETVEYAIITGIIVMATLGVIASIGVWVYMRFNSFDQGLAGNP